MSRGIMGSDTLGFLPRGAYARGRRRGASERSPTTRKRPLELRSSLEPHTSGYEPAGQILDQILSSAMDVTGAAHGFILVSRDGPALEVAASCRLRPAEVIDFTLTRAAGAVHGALREGRASAADAQGRPLPLFDGYFEANSPAVLCLPLDLGLRQSGALCLLREASARKISELDLEIVQALSEQAALAIGAACHQTALTRLEASLSAFVPAHA